jgi:diguanylate cyclase (GGDEF)-like protein
MSDEEPSDTINMWKLREARLTDTVIAPAQAVSRPEPTSTAYLVQISPAGPALGRRHPIGAGPVVIGRETTCSLPVPDGGVSRTHARIDVMSDGRYQIADLNSRNGTYLNGSKVGTTVLADGDTLQVGGCIFRFLAGGNVEAAYHEAIHRLTILDPLTGIHNRRSLTEFLEREVERAARHRRPLAVLLVDIDHFKRVNDRYGHAGGDAALRALADRFRQRTRKDELLARYGGEEFAVVLPETDLAGALDCAERFRRAAADEPVWFDQVVFSVTVSIGIGASDGSAPAEPADLIRSADARLYEAKRAGRNRVAPSVRFGPAEAPIPTSSPIMDQTREHQL